MTEFSGWEGGRVCMLHSCSVISLFFPPLLSLPVMLVRLFTITVFSFTCYLPAPPSLSNFYSVLQAFVAHCPRSPSQSVFSLPSPPSFIFSYLCLFSFFFCLFWGSSHSMSPLLSNCFNFQPVELSTWPVFILLTSITAYRVSNGFIFAICLHSTAVTISLCLIWASEFPSSVLLAKTLEAVTSVCSMNSDLWV